MAQGSAGMAQLLRKKAELEAEEELEVKDDKKPATKEAAARSTYTPMREATIERAKRSVRMVIINEGLGNKRDLRFYGPEAIDSIARLINGAKCYINHKSATDEAERPEGDLWRLCGYWKDGAIQMVEGKRGVVATLVTTPNETGEAALAQCETALRHAADCPTAESVYCGTSIYGDGKVELRKMVVEGQEMEVNYVTEVTDLPSADLVTQPARGGRVLAIVESMRGAKSREEARAMAGNGWFGLLSTLLEAVRGNRADAVVLSTVEAEAKSMKAAEEAEEEARKRKESETAEEACKGSEEDAEESEADEEGDGEKPGHAEPDGDEPAEKKPGAKKTSIIKHEERHTVAGESEKRIRDLERQLCEAKERPAIEALLNESGVKIDAKDVLAMPAASRKVLLGLIESMRGGFTATGETVRGTEGAPASGEFKGFAESVGVRARGK